MIAHGIPTVEITPYEVLLSYPVRNALRLLTPSAAAAAYQPTLNEKPLPEADPLTVDPTVFPPFHGYAASGNATGRLVYANYGRDEDFQQLEGTLGVSVAGAVVIVRYGKIFRGNKVASAEARGAAGVLIYSDPADYGKGPVYPDGPWLPPSGRKNI